MTDLDAAELVPPAPGEQPKRTPRWRSVITLLGLLGLVIATVTMARSTDEQVLPGAGALAGALVLHVVALLFAAQAWIALFPPTADRRELARGLYTSQLTKYLPAGGFVQVASQVALASSQGGLQQAALRLPLFSVCSIVAGTTVGSTLAFDSDLPSWARLLAGCGVLTIVLLYRPVLAIALRCAKRFVHRLPEPDALPEQTAILRSYGFALGNLLAFSLAFAVLLTDLEPVAVWEAVGTAAAAWAAGYLVIVVPGGLGVREAVIFAAMPEVARAPLLAVSVAHRLLGLGAEAFLAGKSQLQARLRRSREAAEVP